MWLPEDVERLEEIYAQPEYLEHMRPARAASHIADFRRLWDEEGFSIWAACERETGVLVGRIGLFRHHDWPLARDPLEVGWVLDRVYWGRGLATEGGRAAIDAWRDYLPDETLYGFTLPANVRSRAVMDRLGMRFGGSALWHGRDHVWYSLGRGEVA